MSPEVEARRKRWTSNVKRDQRIASSLYRNTLRIIQQSKIPYLLSDESTQVGSCFGERLANAIQAALKVSDQLIVVGNDCTGLTVEDLKTSREKLLNNHHSCGYTPQGGVYLFTIDNILFDHQKIISFNWQSKNIGVELLALYTDPLGIHLLLQKQDVNQLSDVFTIHRGLYRLTIKMILSWAQEIRTSMAPSSSVSFSEKLIVGMRGPPSS